MTQTPNIVFAGTPAFAAAHLDALIKAGIRPSCVYTQPDRPAGRGRKLKPSDVKQVALAAGIEVRQPKSLRDAEQQQLLADLAPDIMIVVAYGLILPKEILEIPKHGCINVHASLLPRWRGAAPIHRAIEAGDNETGVTIMQMDIGLDTGDMLITKKIAIDETATSASLHDQLIPAGQQALIETITAVMEGTLKPISQDNDRATYAHKLEKSESNINWQLSAVEIDRKIRAFTPWPGSQTKLGEQVIKIKATIDASDNSATQSPGTILSSDKNGLLVQCGTGTLLITGIQFPGKRMTEVAALINSNQDSISAGKKFQ